MQIELRRVLRAVVVLRGLMIEWVKVKGIDETFENDDRQVGCMALLSFSFFCFSLVAFIFMLGLLSLPGSKVVACRQREKWLARYLGLAACGHDMISCSPS